MERCLPACLQKGHDNNDTVPFHSSIGVHYMVGVDGACLYASRRNMITIHSEFGDHNIVGLEGACLLASKRDIMDTVLFHSDFGVYSSAGVEGACLHASKRDMITMPMSCSILILGITGMRGLKVLACMPPSGTS